LHLSGVSSLLGAINLGVFIFLLFNYAIKPYGDKFNYCNLEFHCNNLVLTASNSNEFNDKVNMTSSGLYPPYVVREGDRNANQEPDPEFEPPKDPKKKD
jgi:hypothetical protein